MKRKSIKFTITSYFFALLFGATLFYAYNPFAALKDSTVQSGYERWLRGVEPTLIEGISTGTLSDLSIYMRLNNEDSDDIWELKFPDNKEEDKVYNALRILQLAREANLFNASKDPESLETVVVFEVKSDNNVFKADLGRKEVEKNVKAQTLINLFRLYAVKLSGGESANRFASLGTE